MKKLNILELFSQDENFKSITDIVNENSSTEDVLLKNLNGSHRSILAAHVIQNTQSNHLFILESLEKALYFLDDLNQLIPKHQCLLFPSSKRIKIGDQNVLLERIEVLNKLNKNHRTSIITYPEAIREKVISKKDFRKSQIILSVGDVVDQYDLMESLENLHFKNSSLVLEPGDYAVRGFIIDIFSYGNEHPFRIVFNDNTINKISYFKVSDQLSLETVNKINVISNIESGKNYTDIFSYLNPKTITWINNSEFTFAKDETTEDSENKLTIQLCKQNIAKYQCIYTGSINHIKHLKTIVFHSTIQPAFNKNFEILISHLDEHRKMGFQNIITVSSTNQMERLKKVFKNYQHLVNLELYENSLQSGFLDKDTKILLYTDHQIFERYHQYKSKRIYKTENTVSIRELTDLKKGDYVAHFDYGIGIFDGLRIRHSDDKTQESIRLIYKNNDVLYISIHSLHKITKYKDGSMELKLDKLGSPRWKNLKEKAKRKIKTIAFDLVNLYAKRKIAKGFAFSQDTYLQNELEASFKFKETADQIKITQEIKNDMENEAPMDRLVCGDVGFGKTEIAIRAAFKAVADNKQVAILVPTTILALQHYKTLTKRLKEFPCQINYINRFISKKETTETLANLKDGLVDIIIGTHRLISKDVIFKDLGLLIIDEEQKFGVGVKDKLKDLKKHVDTLTLTATPIPRTLQFSLMGSRDLSIMTTYPKNRSPIETKICVFNHNLIKEIITHEITRGGQVFFVHNRVQNIEDIHQIISQLCPKMSVKYAHGQMESKKLETTILEFIDGQFDVLITTTIIENGLDIPNANTIIINNAQNFGLADLHQMRGRVGRSNKKAFCYLLTPPFNTIKDAAMQRLNAISNLSNLGDGFNIAMKDLEIRGAGNMLGPEQSGFIEEMGFAHYQKIINEAVNEIKESELKNLSTTNNNAYEKNISCIIETDLALLIPNDYVENVTERMTLYKRLSSVNHREEVEKFKNELIDRFGSIPDRVKNLLKSIELRLVAEKINCDKIILKQRNMILTFNKKIHNNTMNQIIELVQKDQEKKYKIKEDGERMKLYVKDISNIYLAMKIMMRINN